MRRALQSIECASMYCTDPRSRIPVEDAHKDDTGAWWCAECKPRYTLMQYGARHSYPSVTFAPYAVAHGQDAWRLLCGLGKPACIEAWRQALGLDEDEVE